MFPLPNFWFKCHIFKLLFPVYHTQSCFASFWTFLSFCLLKCLTIASFAGHTAWEVKPAFVLHPVCLVSDISIANYLIAKCYQFRYCTSFMDSGNRFIFNGKQECRWRRQPQYVCECVCVSVPPSLLPAIPTSVYSHLLGVLKQKAFKCCQSPSDPCGDC